MFLRPIFCEKLKIAPPHRKTAPPQTFEFPNLAEKSVSILEKTFFFFMETTWFWAEKNLWISDFGRKISLNFGEDLFFFFWRPPDFGRKKPSNLRAFREISSEFSDKPCETDSEQWKRGSRSFALFSLFQNSPPFSKSWLRAWSQELRILKERLRLQLQLCITLTCQSQESQKVLVLNQGIITVLKYGFKYIIMQYGFLLVFGRVFRFNKSEIALVHFLRPQVQLQNKNAIKGSDKNVWLLSSWLPSLSFYLTRESLPS